MFKDPFRDPADGIASTEFCPDFSSGREVPDGIKVQRVQIDPAFQEEPGFFRQFVQRVLKTVKDLREQTGSQCCTEQFIRKFHRIAHFQAHSTFKDLQVGTASPDTDDFRFQFLFAQDCIGDFILCDVGIKLHGHQVPVDAGNASQIVVQHSRNTPALIC